MHPAVPTSLPRRTSPPRDPPDPPRRLLIYLRVKPSQRTVVALTARWALVGTCVVTGWWPNCSSTYLAERAARPSTGRYRSRAGPAHVLRPRPKHGPGRPRAVPCWHGPKFSTWAGVGPLSRLAHKI